MSSSAAVQDAIAEFASAPLWAQIGMALFAIMVVVSLVGPPLSRRKFRRQFDGIVRGLGREPPPGRGWPVTCPVSIGERAFEIRYDIRHGSKGSSYRGPHGYLLCTATRLAGKGWSMHQIDVTRLKGLLARLVSGKRLTGDPDFDERFMVVEDGLPVREGWLDAAMRKEIARFFDEARPGIIWIRGGELQFIMQDPWKGLDGPNVRALLQRQAVLASALERTAGVPS